MDDDVIIDFLNKKLKNQKLTEDFYLAVSELFYELDINGREFINHFIVSFIKHVESQTERKSDLIIGTGFSNYQIEKYLNKNIRMENNARNSFYSELVLKIKSACDNSPDGSIPLKGKQSYSKIFHSFDTPMRMVSSQSMLDSLIKKGLIKKNDNKTISFIHTPPTNYENTKEYVVMVFNNAVRRLTQTLITNYRASNKDQQLTQTSYLSKSVPLSRFESTTRELKELSRKYLVACREIIDRNEAKTDFEKRQTDKLDLELGVSIFLFNNQNEE